MSINIDSFANEVVKQLKMYSSEVKRKVDEGKKDVAKEAVKELRTAGDFEDLTGDYRKGWAVKKDGTAQVVHNKTDYQLTHLLENGHVIKNGTQRSYGDTRKFEHIAPVEEKVIEAFIERVEKAAQP